MMRQKLALVVKSSLSVGLSRMKGFSPVRITLLGSAVLMGLSSLGFAGRKHGIAAAGRQSVLRQPAPAECLSRSLAPVVHGLQAPDRRGDAELPGLDLQGELQGKEPRLLQVAGMEPEPLLLRRAPHVPELALPRPRILGGSGAEPPALADLVGHLGADELRRPFGHRAVASGVDDELGGQFAAVAQQHRSGGDALEADAAFELDAAVGDQFAGADVDVIARAASDRKSTR